MGRGVEQAFVGFERGLRAVAVMDVEIDDRHPLEAVHVAGPQGADRGVVEQAETHRPIGFGMVPGRAHRAKGIVGLAGDDRVDGGDRPRRRRATPLGPRPATAPCRRRSRHGPSSERREDALDVVPRMHPQQIVESPPPAPRAARAGELRAGERRPAPRASRAGDSGWWIAGIVFETGIE